MDKEVIEYLLTLQRPYVAINEIDDRQYLVGNIKPNKSPLLMPFDVHTLTGLVDVVKLYNEQEKASIIHILSPTKVMAYSLESDEWAQRECFAIAEPIKVYNESKSFMSQEEFMIRIQTEFIYDDEIGKLLSEIGNMTDDTSIKYLDDGVTPRVIVKKGMVTKAESDLSVRIILIPMRTFDEIKQPPAQYILRLKKENDMPRIALFESSGNAWKYEAIESIKSWIQSALVNEGVLTAKIIA